MGAALAATRSPRRCHRAANAWWEAHARGHWHGQGDFTEASFLAGTQVRMDAQRFRTSFMSLMAGI
jgi:hypothetical protein